MKSVPILYRRYLHLIYVLICRGFCNKLRVVPKPKKYPYEHTNCCIYIDVAKFLPCLKLGSKSSRGSIHIYTGPLILVISVTVNLMAIGKRERII